MNQLHYPSLELCKKLTEAGFSETEKDYVSNELNGVTGHHIGKDGYLPGDYVCPSVMELLDEIPSNILFEILGRNEISDFPYIIRFDINGDYRGFPGNLPNALAEMWIWLKENNYLIK